MSEYEWTDRKDGMIQALDVLNKLILELGPNTDAYTEAVKVRRQLTQGLLVNEDEILDFLTQASIDFKVNRKRARA